MSRSVLCWHAAYSKWFLCFCTTVPVRFSPTHTETRVQRTSWRGASSQRRGLFTFTACYEQSAASYFRAPVSPTRTSPLPGWCAKRHPSWGGKMVITQGLVAVTQIFSWGRSNHAGKAGRGGKKKPLLFSRGGQRQSVLCHWRSLRGCVPQRCG